MFYFSEMIYVCRSLLSVRFFSDTTDLAYTPVFKLHLVSVQWVKESDCSPLRVASRHKLCFLNHQNILLRFPNCYVVPSC